LTPTRGIVSRALRLSRHEAMLSAVNPGKYRFAAVALLAALFLPASASADGPGPDAAPDPRKGVVQIELNGRAVGLGAVLSGDGRIVTSLSALGTADTVDVRYPDGHTVRGKIGHKDVTSDLALLVPQAGRYTEGFAASEQDPLTVELRVFASTAGNHTTIATTRAKGRVEARSKDGATLTGLLDIDARALALGTPIIDPGARAVGIVVRACQLGTDASTCTPVNVVAPVAILRAFLVRTPANAVPPAPWLGINGAPESINGTKGVRVMAVAPHSPAEKGGLKPQQDVVVAADGQPVESPERLADVISRHAVGETVKLNVFAQGKYREVTIILSGSP